MDKLRQVEKIYKEIAEDRVTGYKQYFNYLEHLHEIFKGLGFICIDNGHDGYCPECEQMLKCEVYKEIKNG